jgi:dienelactone hydrolase
VALETLKDRFERLWPHVEVFGPNDKALRPAVLIFHGCGGVGRNLKLFADYVVELGFRAYVIDSYAARGWSRKWGAFLSCNGLRMRGFERSGEVLALTSGLSQKPEVDGIILAGWSHGAWAIMDLMTQGLNQSGHAHLKDPDKKALAQVKGLFLMYPYVNFLARSKSKPWIHKPKTLAVLAFRDHLASYSHSVRLIQRLRKQGVDIDTVSVDATHAFDEIAADRFGFMKYDAHGVDVMRRAFGEFSKSLFR